jgi:ferredoxin
MSLERLRSLEAHLRGYDASIWTAAMAALSDAIHVIDRDATKIWFAFFPLELHIASENAPDEAAFVRKHRLMGHWKLSTQVDASHRFLYGHRSWPQVKLAITNLEEPAADLKTLIEAVADAAGRRARLDRDRLLGMSAVGLMTLRQAGASAFAEAPGTIHLSDAAKSRTINQTLRRRARDDWQGPIGFLRGLKKIWSVTFDENDPKARFSLINGQEIATAAQSDPREYRSREPRCIPGEGPIPVECRAASCGTCWVGVLGGAEKLSPVEAANEGKRMKIFGYINTQDPKPLIRLACQALPTGAVSVVIPPWNGFTGILRGSSDTEA